MNRYLTGLVLLAASSSALAMDPALHGFYVGGAIGNAQVELEDADSDIDFKGDDTGYKLFAGWRIIDWVAVEAAYTHYGEPRDRVLGIEFESEFESFSLSALGMLPLNQWDLFARAGVASWEGTIRAVDFPVSASEDNVDPLFGFGAQLRTGNLAVRAEFDALLLGFDDDGDDDADGDDWAQMLSLGVSYKF
jgi:OOP family OmpA-OmpF porin